MEREINRFVGFKDECMFITIEVFINRVGSSLKEKGGGVLEYVDVSIGFKNSLKDVKLKEFL